VQMSRYQWGKMYSTQYFISWMSLKSDSHLLPLIHMQQAPPKDSPQRRRARDGGRNSKEKEGSLSGTTPGDGDDFAAHKRL
jgi:hypothetical protein